MFVFRIARRSIAGLFMLTVLLIVGAQASTGGWARALSVTPPRVWRVVAAARPVPFLYKADGATTDQAGNLYVADEGQHRVLKLSPDGKFLARFGSDAPGNRRFSGPFGVAVDHSGTMYVADSDIVKLGPGGRVLARWKVAGAVPAAGLAVGGAGNVFLLTVQRRNPGGTNFKSVIRIFKLSSSGRVVARWVVDSIAFDEIGAGSIAVDSMGTVYVYFNLKRFCGPHSCTPKPYSAFYALDSAGHRVAYVNEGHRPARSLAVGVSGDLFIAGDHQIRRLDTQGSELGTWGAKGCGPGLFGNQLSVAIDSTGEVIVADSYLTDARVPTYHEGPLWAGLVQRFSASGTQQATFGACPVLNAPLFGQEANIALDQTGDLYVGDVQRNEVLKISVATGAVLAHIGHGIVQFPESVAVDAHGDLYVADGGRPYLIHVFSPTGALLAELAAQADFGYLGAMTIDAQGNIYATSIGHVVEISPAGKQLRIWGNGLGTGPGQIETAAGVAHDAAGDVYVSDSQSWRILKFSADGRLLYTWQRPGITLNAPGQLAFGPHGNLFVAETGADRIRQLSPAGPDLGYSGGPGMAPGQFRLPEGIAIDRHGNLFAADTGNDRVQELPAAAPIGLATVR